MKQILFLIFAFLFPQVLAFSVENSGFANIIDPNGLIAQESTTAKNITMNIEGGDDYLTWALFIFALLIITFVAFLKFRKK